MIRLLVAVAICCCAVAPAFGQEKGATAKTPVKGKPESLPGYEERTMEGFRLFFNKKVLAELESNKGKYGIEPLDVLENELKALNAILVPKILRAMQTVRIVVEWDDQLPGQKLSEEEMARAGRIVAVYRGGPMRAVANEDKVKRFKQNAVEILSLKGLAEMHQPGRDKDQIILLHELCHTAHHHFLTFENVDVRKTFQQAMDRELFQTAYARTNESEYFAEISCAYLDRCNFFPHTADELKTYDPVGYQLMERVWGKQDQIAKLRTKATKDREYRAALKAQMTPGTPVKAAALAADGKADAKPVDAEKLAATKLDLAKQFLKDGKKDKARDRLKELVKAYPETAAAKEAGTLLADLH